MLSELKVCFRAGPAFTVLSGFVFLLCFLLPHICPSSALNVGLYFLHSHPGGKKLLLPQTSKRAINFLWLAGLGHGPITESIYHCD